MLQRPTTLVVGAGCSYEYGLPIGEGLKEAIAKSLSPIGVMSFESGFRVMSNRGSDEVLLMAIESLGRGKPNIDYRIEAQAMWKGILHSSSIDRYLQVHRDNEPWVEIGKVAIARAILAAEQGSYIGQKEVDPLSIKASTQGGPHWLGQLFYRLQDGVPLSEIETIFDKLTIITFNYDRVIEHYLFHAVKDLTGLPSLKVVEAMSRLKIVHPYGKIGRLPWQAGSGSALEFGKHQDLAASDIVQAGQRLRTFTETVEEEEIIEAIHIGIEDAERLIFLGFSYLPQNMELLTPRNKTKATIEATCLGMSSTDQSISAAAIHQVCNGMLHADESVRFKWRNMTAGAYFSDFGNALIG